MSNNHQNKNFLQNEVTKLNWWIKIVTANPNYIYYFGDFASFAEAEEKQANFIEDLKNEGAKIISVEIKKCQPRQLTIELSKEYWNQTTAQQTDSNTAFHQNFKANLCQKMKKIFKYLNFKV